MVLDDLGSSLRDALSKLTGKSRLSEDDVNEIVKEIQRSLLAADADVDLVLTLSDRIRDRSLAEEPPAGTTPRDHILRIVYEELVALIGDSTDLPLEPQTIMLVGLQGSGKTTTAAKIAWWFSRKGLRAGVVQTDTFRPGAYEQAEQMTARAEVEFYGDAAGDDPVAIARDAFAVTDEPDVRIIDTAGRHALEDDLIDELVQIEAVVQPDATLLVLDAAIGQGAKTQARRFDDAVGIDGVVITKLDGTAKGGGALTAVNETGSSIAFLGIGEDVQDIERFEAAGFISRLLGMGDLKQLAERVERAMQDAEDLDEDWDPEDMLKGDFTLVDMRQQMQAMNRMGPLDQVLGMIPGLGGGLLDQLPDDAMDVTQDRLRAFEVVMDSMTAAELENPRVVNASRIERIARGSGQPETVVRELLDQHRMMARAINELQGLGSGDMQRMMKRMEQEGGMQGLGGPFG